MLKVGDKLPAGSLQEFIEVEGNGCSIGPNSFDVEKATAGKKIAMFALPGAYTPTCSAKHVPGYVEKADALKAAGVDEIWCVSVNDAFVMGAWGRDQKTAGKVRMMADGSAAFAQATGLTLDLTARGMGLRSNRYSMLVVDGVVKSLNVEAPGQVRGERRRHDAQAKPSRSEGLTPTLRRKLDGPGLATHNRKLRRANARSVNADQVPTAPDLPKRGPKTDRDAGAPELRRDKLGTNNDPNAIAT
jgi:peroxiredoxin